MLVYPSLSNTIAPTTSDTDSNIYSVLFLCWVLCTCGMGEGGRKRQNGARGERERDSICTSEILMEPPQRNGDR